ncbi:MAG: hypothetical protein PHE53_09695 [Thermoguttaceae bacterium]|nr:hypothetical protein [Thermoguttaceae bacterium]
MKNFHHQVKFAMIAFLVLWGGAAYCAHVPTNDDVSPPKTEPSQSSGSENSEESSDSERLAARKRAAAVAERNLPKKTTNRNNQSLESAQGVVTSPLKRQNDESQEKINGYLTRSDGRTIAGQLFLTRDKRIKIEDRATRRQREIPLSAVASIETEIVREWMEEEWRFKENANNEKYFTGRSYPARIYTYQVTLRDGRKIEGNLSEVIYIDPAAELVAEWVKRSPTNDTLDVKSPTKAKSQAELAATRRFLLYKRDKGEPGETLDDLRYVKKIQLGDDRLDEGLRKARKSPILQD